MLVIEHHIPPCGLVFAGGESSGRAHRPHRFSLDEAVDGAPVQRRLKSGGGGAVLPVRSEIASQRWQGRTVSGFKVPEHLFVRGDDQLRRDVAFVPVFDEVRKVRIGRTVIPERVGQLDNLVRVSIFIKLPGELQDFLVSKFAEFSLVEAGVARPGDPHEDLLIAGLRSPVKRFVSPLLERIPDPVERIRRAGKISDAALGEGRHDAPGESGDVRFDRCRDRDRIFL